MLQILKIKTHNFTIYILYSGEYGIFQVLVFMSIQHFFCSLGDAGGQISALCLLLIYFCLSIRDLVAVKHTTRI